MPALKWCICLTLLLIAINNTAQQVVTDTATHKTVAARPAPQKSPFFQWLWGRNNRKEWTTPVHVPVFWLDTACGGLHPYKMGGGNETRSLRLHTAHGKEYVLRSINKSRNKVLPPAVAKTFLEDIINDGISMSYPYGAFAVPIMQQQAGIYHTLPQLVYVPAQQALDTFNTKFGNDLYLFEQKEDGNWDDAPNLGNCTHFLSTTEVITTLIESSSNKADQLAFAKARLFDMLIDDWDRHEDNWVWGVKDSAHTTWLIPIPRDRDQAFYTHNGVLINLMLKAWKLTFMQNFSNKVENIDKFNYSARNMDRFFTNALTLSDWVHAAQSLQQALTDTVIEQSVRQLPPEIFAISGNKIIETLKARRKQIISYATKYYLFIAKEVEITGTRERDFFEVNSTKAGETTVQVFHINSQGEKEQPTWYSRNFIPSQTKEIRLFGMGGDNVFVVNNQSKAIAIRVIEGADSDTAINGWDYKWFRYNEKGFRPEFFYNNPDRFYVGISYGFKNYKWRQEPFASKQSISLRYSISQNAMSVTWSALYPHLVGKWDMLVNAEYDAMRWTNFYGTGNETKNVTNDLNYYRLRTQEWLAQAGLQRQFGKNTFTVLGYYQNVKGRFDSERYPSKIFPEDAGVYRPNQYAGIKLSYSWLQVNDSIVPVQGFTFLAEGTYANNFTQHQFFQYYDARFQWYVPLLEHVSLAIRGGGATVVNDNVLNSGQFYEHAVIGGPRYIRGYRRERFWGKTAVFNGNELRYITRVHTHLFNARVGLLGFFDAGRVWMPGENSDKIHTSYGPGLLFAPFNKLSVTLSYGITEETRLYQLRINTLF